MVKRSRGFIVALLTTVVAIACRDDDLAGPRRAQPPPPSFVFSPGTGNECFFFSVRTSDNVGFAQGIDASTLCNTFGTIHPASAIIFNPTVSIAWISVDPEDPNVAPQPDPVTFTFQRPILNPVVVGSGSFQCTELGEAIAYTRSGDTVHAAFELEEGTDCGENNIGGGIKTPPIVLSVPVDSVKIIGPRPAQWQYFQEEYVCNPSGCTLQLVGHDAYAHTGYTVYFRETPLATTTVRLTSVSGSTDVRPGGTGVSRLDFDVGVYNGDGTPVPNRTVVISLTAQEGTAGHSHTGGKSAGGAVPAVVETGASGVQRFRYNAPVASGPVTIRGESNDAQPAEQIVHVKVPGLVQLADGANYDLVGLPRQHEGRFHGTPALVAALQALADSLASFAATIPSLPADKRPSGDFPVVFGINDMSLPEGGIFDLDGTWAPPHADHRVGIEADVDVRRGSDWDDYANYVTLIWETKLRHHVGDERADHNHFHLRY